MSKRDLSNCVLPERLARIDQVLSQRTLSPTVVLDHVHGELNISAVVRSADAFGLYEIHFIGANFSSAQGISLGAERWVKIRMHETRAAALIALRHEGFKLAVLEPETKGTGVSTPLLSVNELPFDEKLALIFGNEREGVSAELVSAADYRAYIPMYGFVESFNISVSVSMSLICSTLAPCKLNRRQFRLSEELAAKTRAEWIRKSVIREG